MKVLTFANQKGGVGKTALAVHTAFFLAEQKYRVVVIDLDPQENASFTLKPHALPLVASDLFQDKELPEISVDADNLALIPGDSKLVNVDRAEMSVIGTFMKQLGVIAKNFDVAIIDTSPSLSVRTTAALFGADFVASPVQVETYSVQGTKKLLQTVIGVQDRKRQSGSDLKFVGMLPNMVNNTSPMHKANLKQMVEAYPQYVMPFKISNRTSIGEALADRIPVWKLGKSAAREAGKEMREALAEIQKRIGLEGNGART